MAIEDKDTDPTISKAIDAVSIKDLIYVVRNQQIMLDSDLAALYGVETKVFNQTVKRNVARFPTRFRFQLSKDEYGALRSRSVTSKHKGGRRYLPYVFTEQGIAMLSSVLRSDTAIKVSICIMDSFVEMRRFLANNEMISKQIRSIELRQLDDQRRNNERFERIFGYIDNHKATQQKIFFNGQVFDAFSMLVELVGSAEKEIVLIDGYVDTNTLNIMAKKIKGVDVRIYTQNESLSTSDVNSFNAQYPTLSVFRTKDFHDRFLVLDGKMTYHIGASLKDAGKKCFAISLMKDEEVTHAIMNRLKQIEN